MGGGAEPKSPQNGGKGSRGEGEGSNLICHLSEVPLHGVGILTIGVIFGFHFTDPKGGGGTKWGCLFPSLPPPTLVLSPPFMVLSTARPPPFTP